MFFLKIVFINPHLRTCLLILGRWEGRERKGERKKERNIYVRNMDWLPPVHYPPETEPVT